MPRNCILFSPSRFSLKKQLINKHSDKWMIKDLVSAIPYPPLVRVPLALVSSHVKCVTPLSPSRTNLAIFPTLFGCQQAVFFLKSLAVCVWS
ncbi:hypothetical protein FVEG_14805 [Fusarium verticillioides 7600]|uniref:Uncharacterized protein n=1 Tax=Gibberella moniliformis (strain M3125 / FGSC 7600) TaxID=334819 RepID=W7LQT0_GIBM7|nr:hypothetical protein FVEG_14805 [Fusarium verticillioides 7600]EWG37869.1 hypothetical protein FVEG_14805 [Fusarium verticillioides 7600]